MAPGNEHLLDNFLASRETRTLGTHILRLAQANTGPGSGRELRELNVGLPAASILIACEQSNSTEVTKKSAQAASCLRHKDFKRVYETVRAVLDENERASNITYDRLLEHHKYGFTLDSLSDIITDVENEIIPRSGHAGNNNLTRCAVFFWVLNCAKGPKVLPTTETFAHQYDLSLKKFIHLLETMNDHCKPIRKKIQTLFKNKFSSPSKSSAQVTPRKSITTLERNNLSESPLVGEGAAESSQSSPIRRSSRTTPSLYGTNTSPTKATLPPPWKKGPIRELPSKDSPKKRALDQEKTPNAENEGVPQTPPKRRKQESEPTSTEPSTSTFHAAFRNGGPSREAPVQSTSTISSPLKQSCAVANYPDLPSESDFTEEEPPPRRRFRPVYLENKQWTTQDPRLPQIWKKAEKWRGRDSLESFRS